MKVIQQYWWVFVLGYILRAVIIEYSSWLDAQLPVKYTDVDYIVFSDAAKLMYDFHSPYERATYRYSPFLALLLIPNVWLPQFGKHLFALCDVAASVLAALILEVWLGAPPPQTPSSSEGTRVALSPRACMLWSLTFLFSPLAINMSTRGSADSIIVVLLFAMFYCLLKHRRTTAAIIYGVAVHMRVYPIVFAPALYLYIAFVHANVSHASASHLKSPSTISTPSPSTICTPSASNPDAPPSSLPSSPASPSPRATQRLQASLYRCIAGLLNIHSILFACVALLSFLGLCGLSYLAYGHEFLAETYLYHLQRTDVRHNFSPYFFYLYLTAAETHFPALPTHPSSSLFSHTPSPLTLSASSPLAALTRSLASVLPSASLLTLLPQALLLFTTTLALFPCLPACIFLLTLAFVALNKVVTAQYFLWWAALLPLVLPTIIHGTRTRARALGTVACAVLWVCAEAHWLLWAFQLEVRGEGAWVGVWAASLVFLCANMAVFALVAAKHTSVPFLSHTARALPPSATLCTALRPVRDRGAAALPTEVVAGGAIVERASPARSHEQIKSS